MCEKEGLEGLGMRLRRDRVWLRVTEVWWKNMAEYDKVQVCLGVGEYSII